MSEQTPDQMSDPDWLLAVNNRVWTVDVGYLVNAIENAVEQRNAERTRKEGP